MKFYVKILNVVLHNPLKRGPRNFVFGNLSYNKTCIGFKMTSWCTSQVAQDWMMPLVAKIIPGISVYFYYCMSFDSTMVFMMSRYSSNCDVIYMVFHFCITFILFQFASICSTCVSEFYGSRLTNVGPNYIVILDISTIADQFLICIEQQPLWIYSLAYLVGSLLSSCRSRNMPLSKMFSTWYTQRHIFLIQLLVSQHSFAWQKNL